MLPPSLSLPQIQPKLRPCWRPAHPRPQVSTPASPSCLSSQSSHIKDAELSCNLAPFGLADSTIPSRESPWHFFIPLKVDSTGFLLPLDSEFLEERGCVSPDLRSWGPSKTPGTEWHADKSSLNEQICEREIDCILQGLVSSIPSFYSLFKRAQWFIGSFHGCFQSECVTTSGTHLIQHQATDARNIATKSQVQNVSRLLLKPRTSVPDSLSSRIISIWVRSLCTEALTVFIFFIIIFLWLRRSAAGLFACLWFCDAKMF